MRVGYILSVFLFVAVVTAAAAKDDPQAILDKAIQAHGGAERLAKEKVHAWKAKGTMEMPGMKLEYTADYTFAGPDKLRFDFQMDFGGNKVDVSVASDGKVAWEKAGPMLRDMEKDKQAEFHHTVYTINISQMLPLKDKAFTLTSLGESKLGEQTLVGIKASRKGKRDVSLYFDKKTGLLTKVSSRVFDEFQKKEVAQDNIFSGYHEKDGRKDFSKMVILRDGKEFIVEEFSNSRVSEKVDPKLFAKPE